MRKLIVMCMLVAFLLSACKKRDTPQVDSTQATPSTTNDYSAIQQTYGKEDVSQDECIGLLELGIEYISRNILTVTDSAFKSDCRKGYEIRFVPGSWELRKLSEQYMKLNDTWDKYIKLLPVHNQESKKSKGKE